MSGLTNQKARIVHSVRPYFLRAIERQLGHWEETEILSMKLIYNVHVPTLSALLVNILGNDAHVQFLGLKQHLDKRKDSRTHPHLPSPFFPCLTT
jgi:hypothetical protein